MYDAYLTGVVQNILRIAEVDYFELSQEKKDYIKYLIGQEILAGNRACEDNTNLYSIKCFCRQYEKNLLCVTA